MSLQEEFQSMISDSLKRDLDSGRIVDQMTAYELAVYASRDPQSNYVTTASKTVKLVWSVAKLSKRLSSLSAIHLPTKIGTNNNKKYTKN